jgi:integrase
VRVGDNSMQPVERGGWHILRHAFGTHAAMFGVNPWKLMLWMGHKRIDETMLYVHFAEAHLRPLPEPILSAQRGHDDPDKKAIAMLQRAQVVRSAWQPRSGRTGAQSGKCLNLVT